MKFSESIKPISFLKAHASEIIRELSKSKKTIIITQNGEAKAIVQDIKLYEQNQESMAILKILAQSSNSIRKGDIKPISQAFTDLENKIKENTSK
jgi:prevent-host-death family protein